jgi:transcriptional regulator with XRE-family HTH domain
VKQRRNDLFLKAFGQHLKKTRKKLNFSQERLAYEAEIELRLIGGIERGEFNTGLSVLVQIAETLDIEIKELFDFKY